MKSKQLSKTTKVLMTGILALNLSGCMQPPEPVRTTATLAGMQQVQDGRQKASASQPSEAKGVPMIGRWHTGGDEAGSYKAGVDPDDSGGLGDDTCRIRRPWIWSSDGKVSLERWENRREMKLPREVKELVKLLGTQDIDVRRAIAYDLGVYGDVQAVDPLTDLLTRDTNPKVRAEAFYSLWDLMGCTWEILDGEKLQKIVNTFFMMFSDKEESVRKIAEEYFLPPKSRIVWLGGVAKKIKKTRLLADTMARWIKSPDSKVRCVAVEVLKGLGKESLPVLRKVSKKDPNKTVRDAAENAIRNILHPPKAQTRPEL